MIVRIVKLCLDSGEGVLWSVSDVCHGRKNRGWCTCSVHMLSLVNVIHNPIGEVLGISDKLKERIRMLEE